MIKQLIIIALFALGMTGCSEDTKQNKSQSGSRMEKTDGSKKNVRNKDAGKKASSKKVGKYDNQEKAEDKSVYKEALKAEIKDVNAKLPVKVEEGVTVTNFTVEDNDAVYYYMCEEPKVGMDAIAQAQQKMKENTRHSLQTTNDPETIHLLRMLRGASMGLIFRYKGTKSGRTVDVSYSPAELEF